MVSLSLNRPLDDPDLPLDKWVIWSWNNVCWPRADREIHYLGNRKHVLKDWALFTPFWDRAVKFDTEAEAQEFLAKQNMLRPEPYGPLHVTTVDTLRQRLGYPVRP